MLLTSIEPGREVGGGVAQEETTPYTEGENPTREAQQVIGGRGSAAFDLIEHASHVGGRNFARRQTPELRQQVLVEIPARYGGVLESARLDLGAIPVLAERLERFRVPLFGQRRATNGQRVQLLVEQHTCLARFDARLRQRHVGIVAKREPMLSAGYLPSYKGSPEAVGG